MKWTIHRGDIKSDCCQRPMQKMLHQYTNDGGQQRVYRCSGCMSLVVFNHTEWQAHSNKNTHEVED